MEPVGTVSATAGVVHWHGVTATNAMSHLAVWEFVAGSGGEMMEHVGDDEYLAE